MITEFFTSRMLTRKADRMADQNTSARIPTRKAAEDSCCLVIISFFPYCFAALNSGNFEVTNCQPRPGLEKCTMF